VGSLRRMAWGEPLSSRRSSFVRSDDGLTLLPNEALQLPGQIFMSFAGAIAVPIRPAAEVVC
jgi:hypothetical protein